MKSDFSSPLLQPGFQAGSEFGSRLSHEVRGNYTDFNDLNAIRREGGEDKSAALKKIAQQFESILLNTMLKTMREANEVFSEDSMFNSSEMQFHQDMLDHQLSLSLSNGKGIGLADALVRQLQREYIPQTPKGATDGSLGELDAVFQQLQQHYQHQSRQPQSSSPEAVSEAVSETISKAIPEAASDQSGNKQVMAESPEAFVAGIRDQAEQLAAELGVDPGVLMAQAALETGWGQYVIHRADGNSSYNLFNIKADSRWDSDSVSVSTLEFRNGIPQREQASFRAYNNLQQSFDDYADFIKNQPRYQQALEHADDGYQYLQQIQAAGYATDPEYAEKVWRIYQSPVIQSANRTGVTEVNYGTEVNNVAGDSHVNVVNTATLARND